jgi:hypothetical protein
MTTLHATLSRLEADILPAVGDCPETISLTFQTDCKGGAVTCQQVARVDGQPFASLEDGPVRSEYFDYTEDTDKAIESATFPTLRAALEDIEGGAL